MTPAEQSTCQADVAAIVSKWSEERAVYAAARVYEQPESEWGPAEWVIEVRLGKPATHVMFLDCEGWLATRSEPAVWAELARQEIESLPVIK